ncbi:MAG: FG-GAP-like repeat-containing protein [Candidatus Delongbacteria bacterium]
MKMSYVLFVLIVFGSLFGQDFAEIVTGLPGVDRASVAWGDFDNDGDPDILISGNNLTRVYRNDNGVFYDINAGLIGVGYGSVEWGDYDADGDLDILVSGFNGSTYTKIYMNESGVFTDIEAGLPGILHGISTFGDYDNDGDLDVFITGNTNTTGYISRIYRNDSGSFTNSNIFFPGLIYSNAKWGDFDNDGDLDIMLNGNTGSSRITILYRNDNTVFYTVSHGLPQVDCGPFDWGDFDGDGDIDILFTGFTGSSIITEVYQNNGGIFSSLNTGMTQMYAGSTDWGDFDNDGDLDALLLGYSSVDRYVKIYRNDNGNFIDIGGGFPGVRWGWARWGDYDMDGDLDFIMNGSGITKLFSNNGIPEPSIPNPPIALSATNISSSGFMANWGSSNGADGYFIDVANDSVFSSFVGQYGNFNTENVTSHNISNLDPLSRYYFRVRAYNQIGVSGDSNFKAVNTLAGVNGTNIDPGNVWGIWYYASSPYFIFGDITIPDGEILTIEPGCEIIFMGHYRINVQGCLEAVGTEALNISFKAQNAEDGWMGIRFINTPIGNPKSQIKYCLLKDGNANITGGTDLYGGAISVENFSKLEIFNNIFTANKAGAGSAINCNNNANPTISNNTFTANRAGYESTSGYGTINCMFDSAPTIDNNIFEQNWLIGENYCAGAAIRCVFGSNPMIKNNIIRENFIISDGNLSEGTAMYIHSSDPIIMNNLIYDNYIEPATGHGSGGAIFFFDSEAKLINNTIKTNSAKEGGALWFKLSCPDFHNNIIRGNEAEMVEQQIFFDDDESDPNFYHNNIEGGRENFGFKYPEYTFTGAWVNNIDEDPSYEDNGNGIDFNLATDSPCIDTGTLDFTAEIPVGELDLLNNNRISGGTIDIGALECQSTGIEDDTIPLRTGLYANYPNPFNPFTIINYNLAEAALVELNVYNLQGQLIKNLVKGNMSKGMHSASFTSGDINSGIYIYDLKINGIGIQSRKMMLLK